MFQWVTSIICTGHDSYGTLSKHLHQSGMKLTTIVLSEVIRHHGHVLLYSLVIKTFTGFETIGFVDRGGKI